MLAAHPQVGALAKLSGKLLLTPKRSTILVSPSSRVVLLKTLGTQQREAGKCKLAIISGKPDEPNQAPGKLQLNRTPIRPHKANVLCGGGGGLVPEGQALPKLRSRLQRKEPSSTQLRDLVPLGRPSANLSHAGYWAIGYVHLHSAGHRAPPGGSGDFPHGSQLLVEGCDFLRHAEAQEVEERCSFCKPPVGIELTCHSHKQIGPELAFAQSLS